MPIRRVSVRFNEDNLWILELIEKLSDTKKAAGMQSSASSEIINALRLHLLKLEGSSEVDASIIRRDDSDNTSF